jgi:glycosyltransferase involved in cell wall biosynthesis
MTRVDSATDETAWRATRVALIHDWFQGFHGSERVVDAMLGDVFAGVAKTDVFTFHAARELLPQRLAAAIVRESRLGRLPGVRQQQHDPGRWRYLLPYMPIYFERLPLDGYDLVISSSHACAINVKAPASAAHVCYCHSPIRYVWMPESDRDRVSGVKAVGLRASRGWLRRHDLAAAARVDAFAANSGAVRDRIRRIYDRDAKVIHPPVDVDQLAPAEKDRELFLCVHRLVAYKRPEVVVEAFRGINQRLVMVGVGPLEPALRTNLPPNVELHGWLPRDELRRLFARAGGFVHVGEEDFGISMVEALASGTPVIAVRRGGALDIVRDHEDGLLLDVATPERVRRAVREAVARTWDIPAMVAHAGQFSRARFRRELRAFVEDVLVANGLR